MIDLTEISTALGTFATLITAFGGVGAFLYKRQAKRLKEAEAQLAEVSVSKARIEGKTEEWHLYKEQLDTANQRIIDLLKVNAEKEDRHQEDIKNWEERFTNQTTILRGVQRDLIAANEREKEHIRIEAQLEKERDHYKMWRCYREENNDPDGCIRRKPKQPIPIKYVPLNEKDTEETDESVASAECNKCINLIKQPL